MRDRQGKPLILVADDEIRIRRLISDFLRNSGFEVVCAEDGEKALEIFYEKSDKISLIVLDVMMPKADGWTVLTEIKKSSDVFTIMLTAKGEDADQLTGFRLGADDYVTKPFSPSVLVARIESALRRARKSKKEVIVFGDVEIDISSHEVLVGGSAASFTPKEFEMLIYLFNNKGVALSREKLLNAVWSYDYFGDVRTVDTHVKQLRSKLGEAGANIQTVRGIGYKFIV